MSQIDDLFKTVFKDCWEAVSFDNVIVTPFVSHINYIKAAILPVNYGQLVVAPFCVSVNVKYVLHLRHYIY